MHEVMGLQYSYPRQLTRWVCGFNKKLKVLHQNFGLSFALARAWICFSLRYLKHKTDKTSDKAILQKQIADISQKRPEKQSAAAVLRSEGFVRSRNAEFETGGDRARAVMAAAGPVWPRLSVES